VFTGKHYAAVENQPVWEDALNTGTSLGQFISSEIDFILRVEPNSY